MFGNPETTTGGNALKFYASVRLDIRRSTQIKDSDGGVQGNRTKVKVVKIKWPLHLERQNLTSCMAKVYQGLAKSLI
jgi:RecA/RadA recombinase